MIFELDDEEPVAFPMRGGVTLRGAQPEAIEKTEAYIAQGFTRLLFCAAGGFGKTVIFGELARRAWAQGKRTLVIVNRESIVRQTAKRMIEESGLDAEIEMADETASPYAPVVVASTQTLGRLNRLTGFSPDHFHYVFPDEAHFSVAPLAQRIMNYFHYGAESLTEGWERPPDGAYRHKAVVVGFTATPEPKLKQWYQEVCFKYHYLRAVQDGVLVPAVMKSIPVKIDLRKKRISGGDFRADDLSAALEPVIEELAEQMKVEAWDRKSIAFVPSVDCAKLLADALSRRGFNAVFVSGECEDGDEKTERYRSWGKNSVLVNAQIYNFGIDFVDCDCVAWFRGTISKSFYLQGLFRGSRVLRGVIDGIDDAKARRAAIAASAKPNFLILDPCFVSDRIDLCDPYDLYADEKEVKERMKKDGELTPEAAEKAKRDFIKALEREAKKHARRQARVVDPIALSVSLGMMATEGYTPETNSDSKPPSEKQLNWLRSHGISVEGVKYAGLASKLIGRLISRANMHLATPKQLSLMAQLGLDEQTCATLTAKEASELIDRTLEERRNRA